MITSSLSKSSEDHLLTLVQSGDEDAFEELMRRNSSSSYRLALSILRDQQEAEDAMQDSYLNAWRAMGEFHRDSKFSTWMSRIVTNQCLQRLRKFRRASFVYLDDAPPDGATRLEIPDSAPSAESALGRNQMRAVLHREAGKLPSKLREVLVMRDLGEMSMTEVAERLGISILAAKARLNRARIELRARIQNLQNISQPAHS